MTLTGCNKTLITVALLALLAGMVTACEDFSQFSPPPTPTVTEKTTQVVSPIVIKTEDRAILAVYEHLLGQAESNKAKVYLADFYATCDNWSAESELFKDGTRVWYVVVDMSSTESWEEAPYWQQASWFVLQNGEVIPTNRLQAHALRIEADLQELSLPPS